MRPKLLTFLSLTTALLAAVQAEPPKDLSQYPTQKVGGKRVKLIPAADVLMWEKIPVPEAPTQEGTSVLVHLGQKRAWVFEEGSLWAVSPVCSGKPGHETPTGTFRVIEKHREWISTIYHVPMPFFLRLNAMDGKVGLHAGVIALNPASHGCIRLPKEKAKEFFEKVPVGTTVTIRD